MASPSTTQPPLPTADEQSLYYYGLRGRPKLVARSNAEMPWELTYRMYHPIGKCIDPVGGAHPLVGKMDADDHALRRKLHACLGTVDWDSMNVFRIGTTPTQPVILWVGVNPGTLTPSDGLEVAMACRRVLVDAGCPDVHCEIFEGVAVNHAAPVAPLERCISAERKCLEPLVTLTSTIGQSIASEDTPTREGSICLFLKLVETAGQTPKTMALVSAHAVLKHEQDQVRGYAASEAAHRPSVLVPGDTTLERIAGKVDEALQTKENRSDPDLAWMRDHLQCLAAAPERRLGHLFYSRPVQPKLIQGSIPSILDYALVG